MKMIKQFKGTTKDLSQFLASEFFFGAFLFIFKYMQFSKSSSVAHVRNFKTILIRMLSLLKESHTHKKKHKHTETHSLTTYITIQTRSHSQWYKYKYNREKNEYKFTSAIQHT